MGDMRLNTALIEKIMYHVSYCQVIQVSQVLSKIMFPFSFV